jgi:hypothetical protein
MVREFYKLGELHVAGDALQQSVSANGRYGSIATKTGCLRDVRFPSVSDQTADIAGGPFGVTSGLILHAQQTASRIDIS